jgi:hypothetical protein
MHRGRGFFMPELGDALLRYLDCFAAVLGCFVIGTR